MRNVISAVGVAALAGACVGLSAAPAAAQTEARAYVDNAARTVYYTAGDGENNDVTITNGATATTFVIVDAVPIEAGDGCRHHVPGDPTQVTCVLTGFRAATPVVIASLGDLSDALNLRASGGKLAYGGSGDDRMTGSGGAFWGGSGKDTLSGATEQHGDDGADTLTGTSGRDELYGGRKSDTIRAEDGSDLVYGNSGDDEIRGGRGNDTLYGGPDEDVIYGNSGDGVLHGGPQRDQLSGGPGNDQVYQD